MHVDLRDQPTSDFMIHLRHGAAWLGAVLAILVPGSSAFSPVSQPLRRIHNDFSLTTLLPRFKESKQLSAASVATTETMNNNNVELGRMKSAIVKVRTIQK